ncbi:hypothetical protein LM594_05415 [Candidatus Caldipriscus sp.]|nr:hypothetical protein [Candidatus Caldipriscus sp.]
MRYIILGLYVFAVFWLLLSSANLYINWRKLKEIEGEILKKRARIEIWKAEIEIIKNAKQSPAFHLPFRNR